MSIQFAPDGTAYSTHGAGEPVVLIHGVGMQAGIWKPQIDELAAERQVIVYDVLGHGQSPLPPEEPTLRDYSDQLLHLLDHLRIDAANVAGHSMGALIALDFALHHDTRCLRVAALNAVYRRTAEQREAVLARANGLATGTSDSTIQQTIARWLGDPPPAELMEVSSQLRHYLSSMDMRGYARTYRLFASSDQTHAGKLGALKMPALFLTAQHDQNSSPEMSRAMASEVESGVAVVISDAKHMVTVTHPAEVNRALESWLQLPLRARRKCLVG